MDVFMLVAFSISLLDVTICCLLHCCHHFEFHQHIKVEWCPSSETQRNNMNKQISSLNIANSHEKTLHFGRHQRKRKMEGQAITPKPSITQRMRVSSIVVMDEVLQGPKHNNFWCCNVHSRYHADKAHICCCLYAAVEETEFYPIGVLIYFMMLFITIISIFLIRYYIYTNTFHSSSIINITQLKKHCFITEYVQNLNHDFINQTPPNTNMYITIQYVLILSTILWETLLNFYRYYSTRFMAIKLHKPSYSKIFCFYLIYVLIFNLLCVIHIYFTYIIFPIIIFTHCIFNMYCIYGFISVLLTQYKRYKDPRSVSYAETLMNDLKTTINKLAICGICCIIISTTFLSTMQLCYNSNIILLVAPLWWSINAILWNITFVKNSMFIKYQCSKMVHCSYECCKTKIVDPDRKNSGMVERSRVVNYLKNKKPEAKSPKIKYPDFTINSLELSVVNSNNGHDQKKQQQEETKISDSLLLCSKTPSLEPWHSPMSLMESPQSIVPINDICAGTASMILDENKENDTEIVNALRKQSDSSKHYLSRIKDYKMSNKQHYDNTSSSVFELMAKEGFCSNEMVKSLQELQKYDRQLTAQVSVPTTLSNVSEYHASIHPQPVLIAKQRSSHL